MAEPQGSDGEALVHGLYVCATPIGNLEDVSFRLLRILTAADLVACEDTRRTGRLLAHYGVNATLISYHEQNEGERAAELVERLCDGLTVALVSDAGMPAISDPGYRLVRAAHRARVRVWCVPGPSAVPAALAVSGLPSDRFDFHGFVPRRQGRRRELWDRLALRTSTAVLYESPHRVLGTLQELAERFGDREMALCRELSKRHEEILWGSVTEVADALRERGRPRGEITLVLAGAPDEPVRRIESEDLPLEAEVRLLTDAGVDRLEAIRRVASAHGLRRQAVYRRVMADGE